MATSGYIHYGNIVPNEQDTDAYRLRWARQSYSVANNSSVIEWVFEVRWQIAGTPTDAKKYTIMIDKMPFSGTISGYHSAGWQTINSGTITIGHNPDGTKAFSYSFGVSWSTLFGTKKATASGSSELDAITRYAMITSAHSSFIDTDNPTITYSNPRGEDVTSLQACISLTGDRDDVPYRDISKTGSSYTFRLTEYERYTLIKEVGYTKDIGVWFYVQSIIDGVTYRDRKYTTFKLVDYEPILSPTVIDLNNRTLALTGNENILVRYYSTAYFDTGAAARKTATIEYQTITNGKTVLDDYTSNTGVIDGVDSNTFYFSATDSRGNTTRDFVNFTESQGTWIPYIKLTASLTNQPLTANGVLTFTVKGKYYDGSFGAKSNSMELEYMVLDSNGEPVFNKNGSGWVVLGTVSPNVDNEGNYTYTYTISELDYEQQYALIVSVIDELTPVQVVTTVIKSVPVFDWSKSDFHHHTDVYLEPNKAIRTSSDYEDITIIGTDNDSIVINQGSDTTDTDIGGYTINLNSSNGVYIDGRKYGASQILWQSGDSGNHMNGEQTINLKEPVSAQPNGIVLVFSYHELSTGYAQDVGWSTHFVPKQMVTINGGGGQTFLMGLNAGFSLIGAKYLYIKDKAITGHSGNVSTGTNSGISFRNNEFVLRYVIGV